MARLWPRPHQHFGIVITMIHHVSLGTNDLQRAKKFYDAVLPLVGLRPIKASDRLICYGLTETMFSLELPHDGHPAQAGNGTHIAFHAGKRNVVETFYRMGLENGGTDEGAPALRDYDPHYYAAFLRDPDGNKIEVVTFSGS